MRPRRAHALNVATELATAAAVVQFSPPPNNFAPRGGAEPLANSALRSTPPEEPKTVIQKEKNGCYYSKAVNTYPCD